MGSILRILPESQVPVAIGGVETVRAVTGLAAPIFGTTLFTINGVGTENIAFPFAIAGALMAACFLLVATTVWFAPAGFGRSPPATSPPLTTRPQSSSQPCYMCRLAWVGAPLPLFFLLSSRHTKPFHLQERNHFPYKHSPPLPLLSTTTDCEAYYSLTFPRTSPHCPWTFLFHSSAALPFPPLTLPSPSLHPSLTLPSPFPHHFLTLPSKATKR